MAGKRKNKDNDKVLAVEFRVSMHCNACERTVAKAVSKVKGVEKFITDMKNHRVVVTGRINPHKLMKKLKKKTGKKVELVDKEDADGEENTGDLGEQVMNSWMVDCFDDSELHMMFNDENANACSIM